MSKNRSLQEQNPHLDLNVTSANTGSAVDSAFDLAVKVLHARRASLLVKSDQARDELIIARATGLQEQVVRESRIRIGTPIAGRVVQEGQPLLVSDVNAHSELPLPRRTVYSTSSFACAPILIEGEPFGVMNVADKVDDSPFSESDLITLMEFADHVAVCLVHEQQEKQALEQARLDPVTGLLNRRALDERLPQEIERAKRSGRMGCLLMIDVDAFKAINDTFGHLAGDAALAAIARAIKAQLRSYDAVFRYGGDEFAVILPGTLREQARSVARRIHRTVEKTPVAQGAPASAGNLHVSIGVAIFPSQAQTAAEVIEQADSALYDAKARSADEA